MKRICWLLVLVLLLTGCTEKEPPTVATISPGPVTVTVDSVDELLAAIGSNTEIVLEPGCYDLSAATGYGTETGSPYYSWADIGDGWQLEIRDVEFMTIRGSGQDNTELIHTPRYANVLDFKNCANVRLEGFTAGHTNGGVCAGGVIDLWECREMELSNLGLYGCGTTGVRADASRKVTVRSCEIYECSSNGIQADNTDGLWIDNCSFHDLGKGEYAAGEIFWLNSCTDVDIRRCNISDNRVRSLVNCHPSAGIELRENSFFRNKVQASVFDISGGGLVMENCTFTDNEIRAWFQEESATVLDGIGKSWDEDMLDVWYNPPVDQIPAGERTEVTVSTVEELIAAIAPDTEIILKDGTYDLSTAKDYGTGWSEYYYWAEEFDGPELVISGVNNLVIRSESGDVKTCTVTAVPRYADVLTFKDCSQVTVSGLLQDILWSRATAPAVCCILRIVTMFW